MKASVLLTSKVLVNNANKQYKHELRAGQKCFLEEEIEGFTVSPMHNTLRDKEQKTCKNTEVIFLSNLSHNIGQTIRKRMKCDTVNLFPTQEGLR